MKDFLESGFQNLSRRLDWTLTPKIISKHPI